MSTTKNLSSGTVTVYDFGKIKLHAYDTKDALCDAAFIVEGETSLVGIELPAFTENLSAWKEYISSINKPMNDIIVSNHPAGADFTSGMKVWGTENAKKSISGGMAFGIIQGLLKAFGPSFHGDKMVKITNILNEGKNTISGIDFVIYDRGSSFDIEIPFANAIYTHMRGKFVHSIIASDAHAELMIKILESYQKADYKYILSSHANVEQQDAVTEKSAYVKKIRSLAAHCKTQEEFIADEKKPFQLTPEKITLKWQPEICSKNKKNCRHRERDFQYDGCILSKIKLF